MLATALALLVVIVILTSLTTTFALEKPAAEQSMDLVCGIDHTSHPHTIPNFDGCTRRLFIDSGCTPKGTLWNDMVAVEFTNQSPVGKIRFHAQQFYTKAVAEIASGTTSTLFRSMCGL